MGFVVLLVLVLVHVVALELGDWVVAVDVVGAAAAAVVVGLKLMPISIR